MTDLDIDPFEIQSWEAYCRECIAQKKLWMFKKKLSDYIRLTNRPIQQELKKEAVKRLGEATEEKLLREKYGPDYAQVIARKRNR